MSDKNFKFEKGKHIQFVGVRIHKGNPVTGIVKSFDEGSVTVTLTKNIEGLTTYWDKGAEKNFPLSMIHSIKNI